MLDLSYELIRMSTAGFYLPQVNIQNLLFQRFKVLKN